MYHCIDGHERLRLRAGGVVRSAGQRFDAVILAIYARGVGRAVIGGLAVADERAAAVGKQDVAVHGVGIGAAEKRQEAHGFEEETLAALGKTAVHQFKCHAAVRPRDLYLKSDPLLPEVHAAKKAIVQDFVLRLAVLSDADAALRALDVHAFDGHEAVAVAAPRGVEPLGFANGKRSPDIARGLAADAQRGLLPVEIKLEFLCFSDFFKAFRGKLTFHRRVGEGVHLPVGIGLQQAVGHGRLVCGKGAECQQCRAQKQRTEPDKPFMKTHGNAPPQKLPKDRTAAHARG